jgi:hypothetical protein
VASGGVWFVRQGAVPVPPLRGLGWVGAVPVPQPACRLPKRRGKDGDRREQVARPQTGGGMRSHQLRWPYAKHTDALPTKSAPSGCGLHKLSRTGAARRVPSIRCNRRQQTPSPPRCASGTRRGRVEYHPPRFRSSLSTVAVRVGPRPFRGVPLHSPFRVTAWLASVGPDPAQLMQAAPLSRTTLALPLALGSQATKERLV